jgi:hypothetical protein
MPEPIITPTAIAQQRQKPMVASIDLLLLVADLFNLVSCAFAKGSRRRREMISNYQVGLAILRVIYDQFCIKTE